MFALRGYGFSHSGFFTKSLIEALLCRARSIDDTTCAPSGHCLAVRHPFSVAAAPLARSGCAMEIMSIRKDPMCDTSRGLVASKEHVVHCFDVLSSHFSGSAVPEPQFDNLHW